MVSSTSSIGRDQFDFCHLCASSSSVPLGTLPDPPLNLIWWLTFQVPDRWNSIDLADFSGTRPVEFHWSGHWNFKMLCISSLGVWIWLNCIFGLWDPSAMDFKEKNWKNNFQKIIFHYLKIDAFWRITPVHVMLYIEIKFSC